MIRSKRFIPYVLLFALACFAPPGPAAAEIQSSADRASKFVQDMGSRAMALLARYDGSNATALQTELRTLIHESFDLNLISSFALGSAFQAATPAQRQEYQHLFATWTADSYARRLGAGLGWSLTVLGAQPGLETADTLVQTKISRPDGRSLVADLRVRDRGDQLGIVDVSMGGVSMGVSQRDEFASVIHRKGLDGLIGDLRVGVSNIRVEAAARR